MKISSKSQLDPGVNFSLDLFDKPFFFKETGKYKKYGYPEFNDDEFWNYKQSDFNEMDKILFISGPARNGNHILLSMLDGHPEICPSPGEDDMLRTFFSDIFLDQKKTINKIKEKNIDYILKLSGQPSYFNDDRFNKWYEVDKLLKSNCKINEWSGIQLNGRGHITDFQEFIPKINYKEFHNFLRSSLDFDNLPINFYSFFKIYLQAMQKLVKFKEGPNTRFNYRWTGSGLRRELYFLLQKIKNIICLCPIREFEGFYFSFAKRFKEDGLNQDILNEAWEQWRHKTIDYLILKKMYPKNIYFIRFEDAVNNNEIVSKYICSLLGISYLPNILNTPTILNEKVKGNSSFSRKNDDFGKIYSQKQKKLPKELLTNEYYQIIESVNDKIEY